MKGLLGCLFATILCLALTEIYILGLIVLRHFICREFIHFQSIVTGKILTVAQVWWYYAHFVDEEAKSDGHETVQLNPPNHRFFTGIIWMMWLTLSTRNYKWHSFKCYRNDTMWTPGQCHSHTPPSPLLRKDSTKQCQAHRWHSIKDISYLALIYICRVVVPISNSLSC